MEGLSHNFSLTQVQAEECRRDLRVFTYDAWSQIEPKAYKHSWSIDAICDHLAWVSLGEIRRLIITIPPRCTKSLTCSVMWPAWDWTTEPDRQFLTASYDMNLSTRDALKSRRLIQSAWYQDRFGYAFRLSQDENLKTRYSNTRGGHRIAVSVAGRTTGEGGDMLVIDDPHNVMEVYSDTKRQEVLDWYDNSWGSRLNDAKTGGKVIICQRTHEEDLVGHVLHKGIEPYVHLNLPNEFSRSKRCKTFLPTTKEVIFEDPREKDGELLVPDRFGEEETRAAKSGGMTKRDYYCQYQQDPMADDGLILKQGWWREWAWPEWHPEHGKNRPMPLCIEVIQVYDTAMEEDEERDYSARTTWGVFLEQPMRWDAKRGKEVPVGSERLSAILLDRWCDRVEYPDLFAELKRAHKEFEPDKILVEQKSSGHSLLQDARKVGLPVRGVPRPGGKGAKGLIPLAHLATLPLERGSIYYLDRPWAQDVIQEAAKFPLAAHDDMTTTVILALLYLRKRGGIQYLDDPKTEHLVPTRSRPIYG